MTKAAAIVAAVLSLQAKIDQIASLEAYAPKTPTFNSENHIPREARAKLGPIASLEAYTPKTPALFNSYAPQSRRRQSNPVVAHTHSA